MVQVLQAKNITLRNLIDEFGLQLIRDESFFPEWQENLPTVSDEAKQFLDRIVDGFINLLNHPPLLEDVVRMSVIDPLLFLGGFYLPPFYVRSEESVILQTEDEGVVITGSLDTLVLKDHIWLLVVESKRASYSVEAGLAQILAYMLSAPQSARPCFGLITNGSSFLFLKLIPSKPAQYATSKLFGIRNPGDLYTVFGILKRLGGIVE